MEVKDFEIVNVDGKYKIVHKSGKESCEYKNRLDAVAVVMNVVEGVDRTFEEGN